MTKINTRNVYTLFEQKMEFMYSKLSDKKRNYSNMTESRIITLDSLAEKYMRLID